jgi:hypothetical protein
MMRTAKAFQPVLLVLFVFAVSTWGFHLWLILFAAAGQREAVYRVASPLLSLPYLFASLLLPLILLRRLAAARRAITAVFGVFVAFGSLWWILAAEVPRTEARMIVLGRLCWLILLPLVWVAALYSPGVTRFVNPTTRRGHFDKEVSQ